MPAEFIIKKEYFQLTPFPLKEIRLLSLEEQSAVVLRLSIVITIIFFKQMSVFVVVLIYP